MMIRILSTPGVTHILLVILSFPVKVGVGGVSFLRNATHALQWRPRQYSVISSAMSHCTSIGPAPHGSFLTHCTAQYYITIVQLLCVLCCAVRLDGCSSLMQQSAVTCQQLTSHSSLSEYLCDCLCDSFDSLFDICDCLCKRSHPKKGVFLLDILQKGHWPLPHFGHLWGKFCIGPFWITVR